MFNSIGAMAFLIPAIMYLIIIGFVIWLIVRLIRSNEKIAANTGKIADALIDRNEFERRKIE